MKIIELKLEKMLHQGLCLGRTKDGEIALVSGGIPQELVRAEVGKRAGVLQGSVKEIIQKNSARVTSPQHSGLNYGYIDYPLQLQLKTEVLADAYTRACKHAKYQQAELVFDVIASPKRWHYRHTVQPAVTRQGLALGLGYRLAQSHEVQPLSHDPSAHESINAVWQQLEAAPLAKGIHEIVLRCNDDNEVLLALIASASARNYLAFAHQLLENTSVVGVSYAPYDSRGRFRRGSEKLAGKRSILQDYGNFRISTSSSSFAQPNPSAASLLYLQLQQWLQKLPVLDSALDLYAGSGIIAMHLSQQIKEVTALEIDGSAVARGQRDCERLGLDITFIKANAKKLEQLPKAQLISVDPPRAGLARASREHIVTSTAQYLIYVSCDVATWARDVVALQQGGFQLQKVQGFDFYPHTHHIEVLSLLVRDRGLL